MVRYQRTLNRIFIFLFVYLSFVTFTGCSTSLFSEGDQDSVNSGEFNKNCENLDLSQEVLDAPRARILVKCLNSNDSIKAFADLVDKASDNQLNSILDVLNKKIILDKERLFKIDKSISQLEDNGVLEKLFYKIGQIFSHQKLLMNLVKVFNKEIRGKIDPELLLSIQILAQEFESAEGARESLKKALELGIRNVSLESYQAIIQGLQLPVGSLGLKFFSTKALEYAQEKIRSKYAYGKVVLWGLADGSLFNAFDYYYNSECENSENGCQPLSVHHQIQAIEHFTKFMVLDHKNDYFKQITDLYRIMNDSIECMGGTKEIPNADMHVMDEFLKIHPTEIPEFIVRTNTMKMKMASSMCSFPDQFNSLLSVLQQLSDPPHGDAQKAALDRRVLVTFGYLAQALAQGEKSTLSAEAFEDLHSSFIYTKKDKSSGDEKIFYYQPEERYRRLLIQFLGDRNQSVNIYTHLSDLLAELSRDERGLIGNTLYFLNAAPPGSEERDGISKLAGILIKHREQLGNKSIYDVMSKRVLDLDPDLFYEVVDGASEYILSQDDYLKSSLELIRQILLVNDVSPVIDLTLELAQAAPQYENFFHTLLQLASYNEFEEALKLTSKMAQNGKLLELFKSILNLMRNSTMQLSEQQRKIPQTFKVSDVTLPPYVRNFSTLGRSGWNPSPISWPTSPAMQACKEINVDLDLSDVSNPLWNDQIKNVVKCANVSGQYKDIEDFLDFVLDPKFKIKNKTAAQFTVELVNHFFQDNEIFSKNNLNKKNFFDEVSDILINDDAFAKMVELQRGLRFVLNKPYCSLDQPAGACSNENFITLLDGAIQLIVDLASEKEKLRKFSIFGSNIMKESNIPRALLFLADTWKLSSKMPPVKPAEKPPLLSKPIYLNTENDYLEHDLLGQIVSVEKPSTPSIPARIQAKKNIYWQQLQSGEERFVYENSEEFKKNLKPLLDRLSKPRVLEATMKFFQSVDQNPYDPEWFEGWFQRLGANVKPILYYYPGHFPDDEAPTVRLVSQLDLLELIVIDADFSLEELDQPFGSFMEDVKENFAIRYLTKLAKAGDDIQGWIKNMGDDLDRYHGMAFNPMVGKLFKPELKRRLFNLRQVYPVVIALNQQEEIITRADGKKLVRNDMGVLRDLFLSVLEATPPNKRSSYYKEENSLNTFEEIVRFGLTRNIGRFMWYKDKDGSVKPVRIAHIIKFLSEAGFVKQNGEYKLNPDGMTVLDFLLRKNYKDLNSKSFNDRYVLLGKLIDKFFELIKDDTQRAIRGETEMSALLMRAAYNASFLLKEFDGRKIHRILRPVLSTPSGVQLVSDAIDQVQDFLTDSQYANFIERIIEADQKNVFMKNRSYLESEAYRDLILIAKKAIEQLEADNSSLVKDGIALLTKYKKNSSFLALKNIIKQLKVDPEFIAFKEQTLEPIYDDMYNWFVDSFERKTLPQKIQSELAYHLSNDSLIAFIDYITSQETQQKGIFGKKLKFIADPHYIDDSQDFMKLLREGIFDIYTPTY